MDIETRVANLEKLVDSLIKKLNNDKFYDDADKAGMRQTTSNGDEDNLAKIDYLSAMTGIDIPTEDEGVFTDAQ